MLPLVGEGARRRRGGLYGLNRGRTGPSTTGRSDLPASRHDPPRSPDNRAALSRPTWRTTSESSAHGAKYSDIMRLTHSGCHRQFAAPDGLDGAARYPDAVRSARAAAGEDANGRKVGATAVRAGFAVVVVLRELVEDEEDFHVREALQALEACLAESLVDGDRAADGPQLSVCWTSVRSFQTVPIGVISKLGMAPRLSTSAPPESRAGRFAGGHIRGCGRRCRRRRWSRGCSGRRCPRRS